MYVSADGGLAENVEETVSETNSDAMVQENTEQEAEAEQDNGEPTENIENQENIETEEINQKIQIN